MLATHFEEILEKKEEKGIEKGIEKGMIASAVNGIKAGYDNSVINALTNLPFDQIEKLRESLN